VLDSGQSILFRGGGGEDIIDMLLKIWLSVPNVLATIVASSTLFLAQNSHSGERWPKEKPKLSAFFWD